MGPAVRRGKHPGLYSGGRRADDGLNTTTPDAAMRFRLILATALGAVMPVVAADGATGSYRLTADFGGESFTALLAFTSPNNQPAGQYLGGFGLDQSLTP